MNINAIATVALAVGMPLLGQELAATQSAERRDGAIVAADFDHAAVRACGIGQADGQPVLVATIAHMPLAESAAVAKVRGGAIQKGRETGMRTIAAGPGGGLNVHYPRRGVAFTVTPSPDGGMPVVKLVADGDGAQARILLPAVQKTRDAAARHAINTKGTGATNGRAAQGCDAPVQAVSAAPSCSVSGDADAPELTFAIPLSVLGGDARHTRTGHVTLMKRGDGAARAIATFSDGSSADVTASCTSDGRLKAGYDLAVAKK